jgi:hypothetical protein
MQVDVFLSSGVSVGIPDNVDPSTDEGYQQVKDLAKAKFMDMLDRGFDIEIEDVNGDCIGPT